MTRAGERWWRVYQLGVRRRPEGVKKGEDDACAPVAEVGKDAGQAVVEAAKEGLVMKEEEDQA